MKIASTIEHSGAMGDKVLNEDNNEMPSKEKTVEGILHTKIDMINLFAKENSKLEKIDSKSNKETNPKEETLDSDELLDVVLKQTTLTTNIYIPKKTRIPIKC
jgi:hypothetical protein